jgi:hypothetical protein
MKTPVLVFSVSIVWAAIASAQTPQSAAPPPPPPPMAAEAGGVQLPPPPSGTASVPLPAGTLPSTTPTLATPPDLRAPTLRGGTRESHLEFLERNLAEKALQTKLPTVDVRASGTIRAYRLPGGALPTTTRLLPAHAITIHASTSSTTPRGFFIRSIAASGSRAIFLRSGSSSYPNLRFVEEGFMPFTFEATSSLNGDVFFELSHETETPLEKFMARIFKLFNRHEELRGVIQNIR